MTSTTLCSINWNQRKVMELMLKSYVKHHYHGEPLKLMLVDNGSIDDSKQWLTDNGVPFIDCPINIGHEAAVNMVYKKINTRYCLLVDTDIQFMEDISQVLPFNLNDDTIVAGDLITGDVLGSPVKPRIGAWFFFFEIAKMKKHGVMKFRDTKEWSYDTASWMTEQIFQRGYTHLQISRKPGDIDRDVIGMDYGMYRHLGKMSWGLAHHKDRVEEVAMRMRYVEEQLPLYADIDLRGKFM